MPKIYEAPIVKNMVEDCSTVVRSVAKKTSKCECVCEDKVLLRDLERTASYIRPMLEKKVYQSLISSRILHIYYPKLVNDVVQYHYFIASVFILTFGLLFL